MANFKTEDIDEWKAARAPKAVALGDGSGLTITVSNTGTATWVLRYRVGARPRELTLGRYPDVGIRRARELAHEARNRLNDGVDPSAANRAGRAAAALGKPTVEAVVRDWYGKEIAATYAHPEKVLQSLTKHVLPRLGPMFAADVRPLHITATLDAIKAPTAANDVLRYLYRIFRFARKREIVEVNPTADFDPSDAGGREKPRSVTLEPAEIHTLFEAMKKHRATFGRDNEIAVRLLLMLGVRKMELLAAQWSEFNLTAGEWTLPADRNKTEQAIDIPLSSDAIELLRELHVRAAGSPYVFPARRVSAKARYPHVGPDTLNVALDALKHGIKTAFSVHDLRRTMRTQLSKLRVPREIAERCLNHKIVGVEGIYNQHAYFDERAEALTKWAERLAAIERGAS